MNLIIPELALDRLRATLAFGVDRWILLITQRQQFTILTIIIQKSVGENCAADLTHQTMIEMKIMHADEVPAEDLLALDQVVQITARITGAGRTGAAFFDRLVRIAVNPAPLARVISPP